MRPIRRALAAALVCCACAATGTAAQERIAIRITDRPIAGASTRIQPAVSIDTLWLGHPAVFTDKRSTIARHLATLGEGATDKRLRVGAIGSDKTYWSRLPERADPTPAWADRGRIGPDGIAALDTLSRSAGGYGVILYAGIEHFDPAQPVLLDKAVDMMRAARGRLGPRLVAATIGNEPDLYRTIEGDPYPTAAFWPRWQAYRTAFARALPGLDVYGPATAQEGDFFDAFLRRQQPARSIAAVASHDYYLSMCKPAAAESVSIANLLGQTAYETTRGEAEYVAAQARILGVPAIWDERNSVSCAGKAGVSDVYAAALWALDSTLLIAQSGIAGQYFHSSFGRCGGPKPWSTFYSAFCSDSDADAAIGRVHAMPLFYGMLAAHLVGDGTLLTVEQPATPTLRAYALRQDRRHTLVLVNLAPASVVVTVGGLPRFRPATRADLTGRALDRADGIRLGAGTLLPDGRYRGAAFRRLRVRNGADGFAVTVPARAASIIRLAP